MGTIGIIVVVLLICIAILVAFYINMFLAGEIIYAYVENSQEYPHIIGYDASHGGNPGYGNYGHVIVATSATSVVSMTLDEALDKNIPLISGKTLDTLDAGDYLCNPELTQAEIRTLQA